jgi:hypothetical protein
MVAGSGSSLKETVAWEEQRFPAKREIFEESVTSTKTFKKKQEAQIF